MAYSINQMLQEVEKILSGDKESLKILDSALAVHSAYKDQIIKQVYAALTTGRKKYDSNENVFVRGSSREFVFQPYNSISEENGVNSRFIGIQNGKVISLDLVEKGSNLLENRITIRSPLVQSLEKYETGEEILIGSEITSYKAFLYMHF